MTPREENAGTIMPQLGVGAKPHKGLITKNKIKDSACHSRASRRHHIKGLYRIIVMGIQEVEPSQGYSIIPIK